MFWPPKHRIQVHRMVNKKISFVECHNCMIYEYSIKFIKKLQLEGIYLTNLGYIPLIICNKI